ncbi:GNAT family N-acetyltransferase [Streptomyces nogalater]|uniref:GNAT family N-acetyltransferase n=1 Tax=Streptomyces nogalater TaxID=38314 RepID=A0ABW0WLH2_STRNO
MAFTARALSPDTWADFARLAEDHGGVCGGCWCMAFHQEGIGRGTTPERNRAAKERRVREARAHAALVYDGPDCVGWCQFGPPAEVPRIAHRRAYEATAPALPDWRITCFFVHRARRRTGVAGAALDGALAEIARFGGGTVEGYPRDTEGARAPGSALFGGTAGLFESRGFRRARRLGESRWVVTRTVAPGA